MISINGVQLKNGSYVSNIRFNNHIFTFFHSLEKNKVHHIVSEIVENYIDKVKYHVKKDFNELMRKEAIILERPVGSISPIIHNFSIYTEILNGLEKDYISDVNHFEKHLDKCLLLHENIVRLCA